MKHLFILTVLLSSQLLCFAQTFEKSYHIINSEEIALNATEDSNGGFVLAIGKKRGAPSLLYNFGLVHLNSFGDTIWYKTFLINYHPEVKVVRKTTDGYVVLGIADDTSQVQTLMYWVSKFDTLGNLVWLNYYSDPLLGGYEDRLGMEIENNGNIFCSTGYSAFFIVSPSGSLLNSSNAFHFSASIGAFQSEKILKRNNMYHFIQGFSSNPPFNVKPKILKVNSNADTVGSFYIAIDSCKKDARFLKSVNDGFILGGGSFLGVNNLYLTKIDTLGIKIWNKKISGKSYSNCYFTSNTILTNGNIIISGFPRITSSLTTPPEGKAFLYCFNDNGDSLWYKEFSPSDTSLKTEFYDVIATADSGILACGQLLRTNGTRESYIVKLDSNGNLFNPLSVVEKKNETYLHLYPNPANTYTSLHYMGAEKNVHVAICNLQGQTIETWQLANKEEYLTINLEHFTPGFYFCNISKEGRVLQSKKLIVLK